MSGQKTRRLLLFAVMPALLLAGPRARGQLPERIDLQTLLAQPSGFTLPVYGDDPGDTLGSDYSNGIAYGDVNGDGLDDLIVGAPFARPGSPARFEAGVAYIIYGTTDSPFAPVDLNTPLSDPISDAGETRIWGDDGSDHFGFAVASGDINGDGFDDVLIGAPGADVDLPEREDAGAVYVVFGRRDLPARRLDLNTTGDSVSTNKEARILGDDAGDEAGFSLASGDLNGDGYDDILVGTRMGDPGPPNRVDAGEVYVVYGRPNMPGARIDLDTPGDSISAFDETRILGDDSGDQTGFAVATGDVNGDGFDDALIGAPEADPGGRNGAGKVYAVYGRQDFPRDAIDLTTNSDTLSVWGETRFLGDDRGDRAGASIASGDLDRDGFDEAVIGVPEGDPEGGIDAGEVYVIYGRTISEDSVVDLDTRADRVSAIGETRVLGEDGEDRLGFSVASSDVNGDGFDDLVAGVPFGDRAGSTDSGEAIVVYWKKTPPGSPDGNGSVIDLDLENVTPDLLVLGAYGEDFFGYGAEGGGDFDRDGFAEFAASAFEGDNPDSHSFTTDEGYVAQVFGDGTVPSASAIETLKSGDVMRRGIGGRLSPVIRTWVSFDGGQGPSSFMAEIVRTKLGISNLGGDSPNDVADVYWKIESDRVSFASVEITFQYTDREIGGLEEGKLRLYESPSLSGPWNLVPFQTLDTRKNEIAGRPTTFSHFAILETPFIGRPGSLWVIR